MSTPATEPPPGFFRTRRTLFKILAVPATVIAILVTTLLLGSTSHQLHTGSVLGLEMAALDALRLAGVPSVDVEVAGTISTANPYWGRFLVAPSTTAAPGTVTASYGFAHFERQSVQLPNHAGTIQNYRWVVVALGTSAVGCPGSPSDQRVPAGVLASFALSCPS